MIRVCHVTSVHKSNDNRIFQKECASLAAAGYDVTLVAPGESREEKGVHVIGVGDMPPATLDRLRTGAFRRVTRRAEALDADLYHIHDPELLPFLLHMKGRGKLCIFDSHEYSRVDLGEKRYLGRVGMKLVPKAYAAFENHVLRQIDAVVVPCTLNGENLFARWAKRSVLVDNYPRREQFPEIWSAPDPESGNAVGYLGTISDDRGAEQMILAAYRAGARLRMAGPIWHEYLHELQAMPEYACVEYLGPIPPEEIPAFCRSFRVGLCLLQDQGQFYASNNMSTKVYEYMGTGLPAIVSATPDAGELDRAYHCLWCVDPGDVEETARAIRAALDDPEETARMGQNGFRAVRERYNWGSQEKKLLALYRELCGE